ncbi:alpha/beta hydrolase family protein, partial [Bacteroidota bacterium]
VATQRGDIAFIVLLAGPGTSGRQILIDQAELIYKASGGKDDFVSDIVRLNTQVYDIILSENENTKAEKKIRKFLKKESKGLDDKQKIARGLTPDQIGQSVNMLLSPWFRYFLSYDPAPVLKQLKCPVLAINGSLDLQVPATKNLEAINVSIREGGNKDVTIEEIQGLNHLFQHTETGLPNEYGKIEETMAPQVLDSLTNWIISKLK